MPEISIRTQAENKVNALKTLRWMVEKLEEGVPLEYEDLMRGEYRPVGVEWLVPLKVRVKEEPVLPKMFIAANETKYVELTDDVQEALRDAGVDYDRH